MTIGFLHTSEVHRDTFTGLLDEVAPGWASTHVVDAALLADARERGGVDDELNDRLVSRLREAANGASVVVCTCSTISGSAENLSDVVGVPVVRVDRPMVERAVSLGSLIAAVAALQSTIAPTIALIREVAGQRGLTPAVEEVVLSEAWSLFEAGDLAGYATAIAMSIDSLVPTPDVVVLAQASMAAAAELCTTTIPVLSSPRSAVEAAVALV
jgi:hypothetical protein